MIKKSDVEHVALLARLELSDDEKEIYTRQLNDILGHFESLQKLDTANVEPTAHVLSLFNVFREDKVDRHLPSEKVLANCPDRDEDCFRVPKIV
ncbi:MAG TPA: Asp-tRNA(Asn)/Glu-tRNA(Gln) amidotransferase subunit GatB [Desulfotomaculum sp.]|nr:MAG: Aspartyl/glutamyl-tRNA(Asn/Gln) amidotransferase subunit C [Desulfotomaculum sp. 46_80]KUK84954.1 MAG: Aspartyl/glutamyl-tRNA(Asn/Gln) amidotransferase subunit C [Desulfofundulus kuznetsovii]HAG10733.1 Asp-tRNA(Asn)/Glu-tRNA(Gln) amidotransferase subunit GatB [Desulfotomaculum sp.]HBY03904.1 Asp-tRNA(Asn)/Glu-tRNA(Gln) amidotransferase subunit GatB [Desulfotomaculum sp.]